MAARESLARLDGVGRHLTNPQLLLAPLQQREALRSSSMEGTYATPEELLLYQLDPREPTSREDRVNAWREVFNYGRALQQGMSLMADGLPLSLRLIRDMHQTLLGGVRGQDRRPGHFRDCQVHVGVGARFVPPPPSELMPCLHAFESYHHESSTVDPLLRAFMAHYQFETIHPFRDGNGRIGRVLLSLTISQWLELGSPWLYMSAFFERHKDDYIDRMFNVSADGQWEPWLSFCLQGVIEQSSDTISRIDRLVELRQEFTSRVAASGGSARLTGIVERLFSAPIVTIPQVVSDTGVTYPTARSDVQKLVDLRILSQGDPSVSPKYFFSRAIFDIAYGDS
ncbi:MAG: Fic family protein [Xanthomonadales bacterium]|nr:Fic family protein [Xanthomonadales bacterium]MCB1640622.1 Fic family protein [Xanthomonadales bacterium]